MFQFRRFPSYAYFIQHMMIRLDSDRIAPFGNPRIYRLLTAPRGLSQFVASFFGSQCQGIPLVLFVAWPYEFAWFFLNNNSWTIITFSFAVNKLFPFLTTYSLSLSLIVVSLPSIITLRLFFTCLVALIWWFKTFLAYLLFFIQFSRYFYSRALRRFLFKTRRRVGGELFLI